MNFRFAIFDFKLRNPRPILAWHGLPARGVLLLLLALSAACNVKSSSSSSAPTPSPQRLISLAPNLTELVYALGEQDRLVGVTQYCRYPPEAAKKPRIGALMGLEYEKVAALRPDLALVIPAQNENSQRLARLGIPSHEFRNETIADIRESITDLSRLLGCPEKGGALLRDLETRMNALRSRFADRPNPPRVLFIVGRNPGTLQQIYACGSGNYLNELLESVGATNVMGESKIPWPLVSKESILALDPDLILDSSSGQAEDVEKAGFHMKAWDELPMLRAVRDHRIVMLRDEHLLIPGPSYVNGAERLAAMIHQP